MINQRVVQQWLDRETANFDWIKSKSDGSLERHLAKLNPKPDFNGVTLWRHQLACFTLLNQLDRFIFHINMGGGKTLLTLMFLKYKKQCGLKPRAIVFVPYITSVETWVDECAKHTPDLKCVPLLGTTKENLAHLQDEGDLFVICYQSAVAMLADKRTPSKWSLSPGLQATAFGNCFNFMVCDEIHKTKSQKSLAFQMCKWISGRATWAIGLTGTPFGRDLQDLWPQFYLIDFGETLGRTLSLYRECFFKSKVNYWGGWEWSFKREMLPKLTKTIKNRSIHYGIDEFYDMPPRDYVPKKLHLPEASRSYVKIAMDKMREALKGGEGAYRVVESEYLVLRQLASGFMTLKGEDDDRLHIKFDENPKLEALQDLVEQMPPNCKMVVFHHFVYTNSMISDMLVNMKIRHARIWGGQRDPIGQLKKFKNDSDCRVLVINSKSGSSSLNLQNANYVCFFEQPDSPIDRQQAEARCWRPGQDKRVFYYDLLMHGTMDERIYYANKAGEHLLKALLEGKQKL